MSKTLEGKIDGNFTNLKTGIYQCTVEKGKQHEGFTLKENLYNCKIQYGSTTYHALGTKRDSGYIYHITEGPDKDVAIEVLDQVMRAMSPNKD